MEQAPKAFYVYQESTKSFKKMYFSRPDSTGNKSWLDSGVTKLSAVD